MKNRNQNNLKYIVITLVVIGTLIFSKALVASNSTDSLQISQITAKLSTLDCTRNDSIIPHDSLVKSESTKFHRYQPLPKFLEESSGLCETPIGIWSVNDSQNPSDLYLLKRAAYVKWRDSFKDFTDTDFISFTLPISNNDWESIESDGTYIYIGDFGNNMGNRQNLVIIRIRLEALSALLMPGSVDAKNNSKIRVPSHLLEYLHFSYSDQIEFKPRRLHHFDCEAMLINESEIWLLSKNWNNLKCRITVLSKALFDSTWQTTPLYPLHSATFNPRFLVTDATQDSAHIYVCGYGPSGNQYIGRLKKEGLCDFKRMKIALKPAQVEGIHLDSESQKFLLSTESRKSQKQALFILENQFRR